MVSFVSEDVLDCGFVIAEGEVGPFVFRKLEGTNNTYLFNATDIGAEAADRLLVIVVSLVKFISPVRSVSAVTVNGNAAAIPVSVDSGLTVVDPEASVSIAIATYAIPSGTTADIHVTSTGNVDGAAIAVYPVYGLGSMIPFDTASNASFTSNPSTTIDVPINGIIIGGYVGVGGTPGDTVWTGLTETYDDGITVSDRVSGAQQVNLSAQTGRTIAVANAASGREAVIALSLG